MVEHNEPSQLRLASAKRRIAAFLDQIAELKASSFPHDDGRDALIEIEHAFLREKGRLDIPTGAAVALIDETCLHLSKLVSDYTEIMGFILRSTNVRNPFELHFALAKLVKTAIGDGVKLLISSEWNFVPFTWPMSLDLLPDFVLIGSPAPESGNVLIAPLAGHEIGHTAWGIYDCVTPLISLVATEVDAALSRNATIEKRLLEEERLDALGRNIIVDRCGHYALRQLEETFCDLFGLYVFGPAYLFAYDYFVAPGDPLRCLEYPSDRRRMEVLHEAANSINMTVDDAVVQRWYNAVCDKQDRDMAVIIDEVVDALVPGMRDSLFAELKKRSLAPPDPHTVANVLASFERRKPYSHPATLAEIVTAGWSYLRKRDGLCGDSQRDEYKVLADLMLKSIEVAEYLERSAQDA